MITTSVLGHEIHVEKNDNGSMTVYDDCYDLIFDVPARANPNLETVEIIMRERLLDLPDIMFEQRKETP